MSELRIQWHLEYIDIFRHKKTESPTLTCRSVRSKAAAISILLGLKVRLVTTLCSSHFYYVFLVRPAQVLVKVELLLELEQLGVGVGRPQPPGHPALASN